MSRIEYRTDAGTLISAVAEDDEIEGLVTPFNVRTQIGDIDRGGFNEEIAPGAFTKTLQERDVVLLFQHNTSMPLARTSVTSGPGSLSLTPDAAVGLRARSKPVDTTYGRDLMALTRAGVVKGMSFGFEVIKDSWTDANGQPSDEKRGVNRTVLEVRLHEVTATAFPAYETTELSARSSIAAARGLEDRAAVATYEDLATCECGAEDQYGTYCAACGKPMRGEDPPSSESEYCTSCGSPLHVAEGRSLEPGSTTPETEARHAANIAAMATIYKNGSIL